MARLNEPPTAPAPSAETVDAVKRRFLRQNRELAKTNSQQSIRIRTLENDCSRLLAENLSLREQVLLLQNALEAQSNRPSQESIDSVKSQLEAKIQELGGLVADLDQLTKKDDGLPRCKSQTAATRRSPDERQWRSGLGLQEVENAMLPTITEGKHYPRRTMNADELREMMDDADSQSPDIGPPPVARFEDEDPIAFDPNPMAEAEQQEPELPNNLETRRKRRESGTRLSSRRVSLFESPPDEAEEVPAKTVRAGAKRKFNVQEDDEKAQPQAEPFRFSRKNAPTASEMSGEARPKSPERPILRSKPVNTDPVISPKKQRSSVVDKPEKRPISKTGRSRLTITRNVPPEPPRMEIPEPLPTAEIILDSLPPKTPAPDDIFSPPSTLPSTSRPESKDTPPPGELSMHDQNGMAGRPSRRARAQVSYKEPSLNTKMRRPGKELVDAVLPGEGRISSADSQAAPSTVDRASFKQETDESSWKPLGTLTTAGRRGDEDGEMGSPLRQKLDRKEEIKSDLPKLNSTAASHAISAMIEETSTARRRSLVSTIESSEPSVSTAQSTMKTTKTPAAKQEQTDDLAIFDFNESSPQAESASTSSRPRIDLAQAARSARRHSSVPAVSATGERKAEQLTKAAGGLPTVHKRTGSGGTKSASTASSGRSMSVNRTTATSERKPVPLPSVGSADLRAKLEAGRAVTGAGSLRSERAASRRKSMML